MLNLKKHVPATLWLGACFSCLLLLVFYFGTLSSLLEFDRAAIADGQWWRIFTGNLTHFTLYHSVMNVAGFMVILWLLWLPQKFLLLCLSLLFLPVAVGTGLFLWDSTDVYRGFSGALYGLLAMALAMNFRRDRLVSVAGLVILAGKIVYEQLPWFDAGYMTEQIGAPVAGRAHLFGVLSGVLVFLVDQAVSGKAKNAQQERQR